MNMALYGMEMRILRYQSVCWMSCLDCYGGEEWRTADLGRFDDVYPSHTETAVVGRGWCKIDVVWVAQQEQMSIYSMEIDFVESRQM